MANIQKYWVIRQYICVSIAPSFTYEGVQWLSGRVLDSRLRSRGLEPHRRHCVVSLSKNIYPSLVLVQPRKNCPFITERLLMGRKESNQTKKKSFTYEPQHEISNNVVCATTKASLGS